MCSQGNSTAGVTADPGWQPLLTTVPEPDYPSGHGVLSGVAEAVLYRFDLPLKLLHPSDSPLLSPFCVLFPPLRAQWRDQSNA